MPDSTRTLALTSGCFAALGWGLTGILIKLMPQFTTLEVLSIRLVVAFLVMFPIFLLRRSLRSDLCLLMGKPLALVLSSLMVLYYLFAVRAFQLAPVSDVVLMVGLSPLLGLAVKFILRKPLVATEGIGAIAAFSGLVLFILPKLQGQGSDRATYLMGLFFAFLSAAITLAYASLFKYYAATQPLLNPVLVAFITFAIGSMIITPITLFSTSQHLRLLFQPNRVAIALALGVLSTVIPTVCYSYAARNLSPILTTALNLITPIFAAAIAAMMLGEHLPLWSVAGAAVTLVGILTLSLPHPIAPD
ncbi:DMT family transporter [Oculatella sp. LEGE 06141]|uniref:DMT family transporter n=1 Tax=Oculatella sp. LEGE 06141 TaxID=1828648 RepID=UPI001881D45D|nr:DMT family transporter [Oculatella sp. LEGE 06141]MBE9181601.1 DMT family transporter [Oculatella sp. LEGE 06141]